MGRTKHFTIVQGEDFRQPILPAYLAPPADPVFLDLTGYVFEGDLRVSADAPLVAAEFSFPGTTIDIDGVMVPCVEIFLDRTDTESLPAATYAYDIFYTPPGGDREQLLRGSFIVQEAVTR